MSDQISEPLAFIRIGNDLCEMVKKARETGEWDMAYTLAFTNYYPRLKQTGIPLDGYNDPDTTAQADVEALATHVQELIDKLLYLLPTSTTTTVS